MDNCGASVLLNKEEDATKENKGYLSYLSSNDKNMIQETTYYLGSVKGNAAVRLFNETRESLDSATLAYNNERNNEKCIVHEKAYEHNCHIWPNYMVTWQGKIGLLYASDILYSLNSSTWSKANQIFNDQKTWLGTLLIPKEVYLITPSASGPEYIFTACSVSLDDYSATTHPKRTALPTLYLKSSVKINSGIGTQDIPYTLTIE